MNLFVLRLFAQGSVSSLRNCTCSFITRNALKIGRSSSIQKCYKNSTTADFSKFIDSVSTDEFDFDEDSSHSKVDVEAITNGDPNKLKTLKMLQVEVEVMKLRQLEMPSTLSTENWKEMMMISSKNQRRKYLTHLFMKEKRISLKKEKKQKEQETYKKFKATYVKPAKILNSSSPLEYSLTGTCMFNVFSDRFMNQLDNYKLLQAEWFGPHIIVDCGYDLFMSRKNLVTCARHMLFTWSKNRESINPFDIFFCNLDKHGRLWEKFTKMFVNPGQPDSPIHSTDKHYLNFFPKEKLVYLTPDCHEVLAEYNPDDIYIIGAYVDFGSSEPLSLAKAKKEGLRKAKLPLDKYLNWKRGSKSLSLHTVIAILNDLKDGESWSEALKQVPLNCMERDIDFDDVTESRKINRLTAKSIRENYRKNLVYDLLLKERFKSPPNEN